MFIKGTTSDGTLYHLVNVVSKRMKEEGSCLCSPFVTSYHIHDKRRFKYESKDATNMTLLVSKIFEK